MSDSARLIRPCDIISLRIISKFYTFICMEIPFQLKMTSMHVASLEILSLQTIIDLLSKKTIEAFHRKRPLHLRILLMISEHLKLDLRKRENKF